MASRAVVGVDGPVYELNARCAVPGCAEASERHHLWRRSFLGGDYWWVQLPDARVIGNCVGLCSTHHRKITENEDMIAFLDDSFMWGAPEGDVQALAWQPPEAETYYPGDDTTQPLLQHEHDAVGICPACHQKIRPKTKPELRKNRRTWSIAVPKDEQENGAAVLDTLLVAAREELAQVGIDYGDENKYKYHVLATSLGLFVQHYEEILSDA